MNITVVILLVPLSMWTLPIHVPPNYTAVINADLPSICNATGIHVVQESALYTISCVNTHLREVTLIGHVEVEYVGPAVPPGEAPPAPPFLTVAAAAAAAAGLSHLFSNRRELLAAALVPIIARIKKAAGEDPARREILRIVEEMGAVTLSQLVRRLGKGWGAVQWHVYVLEREGKLRCVKIGAFTYYFTNPRAAAEVILSSVDPGQLSPEDREKLDIMAAS